MKIYVVHHEHNVERRQRLEKELKRLGLNDVEWVTSYPPTDKTIDMVRNLTGTKIPNGYISTNLKHYDALHRMVTENIQEAIIFEDDVEFSKFFDISKIPRGYPYIKLGNGVPDMNCENSNQLCILYNNAGAEAYYVTRMFARDFLENIDLLWTVETEQHAYLHNNNLNLYCVPMCFQKFETSVFEPKDYGKTWIEYIQDYKNSKKISYVRDIVK